MIPRPRFQTKGLDYRHRYSEVVETTGMGKMSITENNLKQLIKQYKFSTAQWKMPKILSNMTWFSSFEYFLLVLILRKLLNDFGL